MVHEVTPCPTDSLEQMRTTGPLLEFVIPRRPISLQIRNRSRLREWKEYVADVARELWTKGCPVSVDNLSLTLVYLSDEAPLDVDNIIKPIQDALVGLVLQDDALVCDVRSHRRMRTGTFDVARLPVTMLEALNLESECVYVRVGLAPDLEDVL